MYHSQGMQDTYDVTSSRKKDSDECGVNKLVLGQPLKTIKIIQAVTDEAASGDSGESDS